MKRLALRYKRKMGKLLRCGCAADAEDTQKNNGTAFVVPTLVNDIKSHGNFLPWLFCYTSVKYGWKNEKCVL